MKFLYQGKLQPLGVLREDLKAKLEKIKIGGKQIFKVWIHEDESNAGALINNWDECLDKARDADVFIVLYNGRAGWIGDPQPFSNGLGICHAELSAAYNSSPAKVRSIHFKTLVPATAGSPDEDFQAYVRTRKFPAAQVTTGEEALQRAEELAAAIVLSLARDGRRGEFLGELLRRRSPGMEPVEVPAAARGHDRRDGGVAARKGWRTGKSSRQQT